MATAGRSGQAAGSWKRVVVGAVACLAVAGTILAGVIVSHRQSHRSSPGSTSPATATTQSLNGGQDPYSSLVNANKIPVASTPATSFNNSSSSESPAAPATIVDPSVGAPTTSTGSSPALETERPGVVDSILNSLGFGTSGIVNDSSIATVGTWKALNGAGHFLCYPANGPEFIRMAMSPDCTVIYLRNDLPNGYTIKDVVNITDTKIIIGNPIAMPSLNTSRPAVRLFDVYPTGTLDVRFVHMFRGFGRAYPGNRRVIAGGTIRAHPGAHVAVSGSVFDQAPQTFNSFRRDLTVAASVQVRVYGGHVLILGGNFFMAGCTFIGFAPYGTPIVNNFAIGGQVLVVAGNALSTGTWHIGMNLFVNFAALGNNIAVLGGTYTWVGGGLTTANGAQAQWASGAVIFVGAGVLVGVGIEFITTTLALVRAAMGEWCVATGVKIFIGFTYVRAYGVAQLFGVGALQAVGAGINRMMSGSQSTVAITQSFMGAGGTEFCGTGSMVYFAIPRIGIAGVQSNIGSGMNIYNGGGVLGMNWAPSLALNIVRSTIGCATESCLYAGWGLFLNSTRPSYQVVNYFYGLGNTVYVGAGGAVLYRNQIISARVINYSRVPFAIQIAGVGILGPNASENTVIYDNKSHPFGPSHSHNKNHQHDRMFRRHNIVRSLKKKGSKMDLDETTASGTLIYVKNVIDEKLIDPKKLDLGSLPALPTFSDISDFFNKASVPDKPYQVSVPKNSKQCYMCGCNDGSCGDHVTNGACDADNHCESSAVKAQLSLASKDGLSLPSFLVAHKPDISLSTEDETKTEAEEQPRVDTRTQGHTHAHTHAHGHHAHHAHAMHRLLNIRAESKLDTSEAEVPDTTLMWHELVVYCKNSSQACADEAAVKGVLYEYLNMSHSAEYALTVANTELHPAVAKVATEELYSYLSAEEHAECRGWDKFNVYATAHDDELVQQANVMWEAAQADPSQLLQHLQEKVSTELCDISVKAKTVTTYPNMENMPAYNPHNAGLIGPSLTIVADDSIAPLTELVAGKSYNIHAQNFPHTSTVLIKLRRGVGGDRDDVATLNDFDDSKKVATVRWTVPADAQGTNYLVAYPQDNPLLFTFSNAFDVVTTPTRPGRRW